MKTTTLLIGLLALTTVFTSCSKDDIAVIPSGSVSTINKAIGGYDQLDVSDAFNVYVTFSDEEENVEIEANSNLQAYIYVEKQNDHLSIELDDDLHIKKGEAVLNIYITAKRIDTFSADGAVSIQLENELQSNAIDIQLSGASHFSGTLYAEEITSTLLGASGLDILGETGSFHIDADGASNMEGFGFVTGHLNADLNGASTISLTVLDKLNVKASGASIVNYKGDGIIESQDLSGSSQIVKIN